jgi:sterol desaturase/sphingolipid hydroxylase (fatty acid hydroxylase superfamily)
MRDVGDQQGQQRNLTVVAVPAYFATMAIEHLWLRRRAAASGNGRAGDYERRDTMASLSMGVGSLVVPLVTSWLLRPFTPGKGRWGRKVVGVAVGAAAVTTAADLVARRRATHRPILDGTNEATHPAGVDAPRPVVDDDPVRTAARRVAAVGGVTAVVSGGLAVATGWQALTAPERLWRRRLLPSLGTGPVALAVAVAGWDFVYYWNHRFMHTSRCMWALHVVHHSSERYNLSTALRQPVADSFGVWVPYGLLCLLGVPPPLIARARDLNLLYQYWIHTETIGRLGPAETALNTPSHHRVHHGSNRQYLDRNHGSILIVWDRLFGTFEPEDERVVYGLTENIRTFNVGRIATHEYVAMLRDVAGATGWGERLSYVVRGPGWAKQHKQDLRRAAGHATGNGTASGPGDEASSTNGSSTARSPQVVAAPLASA